MAFVDKIQDWFERKRQFWLVISVLTFSSVLILEAIFIFASQTNPKVRQEVDSLVIAILTLFVFSIFWKSIVHAFLSFVGALVTYSGMFFFHTTDFVTQMTDPYVANRLGFGIKHATSILQIPLLICILS